MLVRTIVLRMLIDRNGTKWMATNRDGVVGFNESNNTFKKNDDGTDTGNLPASDVRALAIDNRNQLWIGTIKGLRVLPNIGNFQTGDQKLIL
jgi:ligand-binding sensor domain-containing protein